MYTKRLAAYIKEKRISIRGIAEETGIPYHILYDSLSSNSRSRELRIDEFMAICNFLDKKAEDFMDETEKDAI